MTVTQLCYTSTEDRCIEPTFERQSVYNCRGVDIFRDIFLYLFGHVRIYAWAYADTELGIRGY